MRKTLCLIAVLSLGSLPLSLNAQTLEQRPAAPIATPAAPEPRAAGNSVSPSANPVLAQGINLQVQITRPCRMKVHETILGRLLHPIYIEGKLAVPEGTPVHGAVVSLQPDRRTRWNGRLRGDFTPFHTAQVEFDQLLLPGGPVDLRTTGAVAGLPVLHLAAPGAARRKSLIARAWAQVGQRMRDQVAFFIAPGLGDRALQLLYSQLPVHPERIPANTMWSFDLAAPVPLPGPLPLASQPGAPPTPAPGRPEVWSIHALLTADLSSATAKPGDPVQALVLEPVFDRDHQLVVPQDSLLVGKVTGAKAARSLGRNGKLRFTFQQVRFPPSPGSPAPDQAVQGALAGATAQAGQGLSLDAEGTIAPRNQASAIAPLLLTVLAGRALDSDGNLTAQTGVASNGFGLVGRVTGLAAGSRNLAAGIGFYAAGLSFYDNFLHPGRNVVFPKNTRIEIETTPLRAPVLTPASQ